MSRARFGTVTLGPQRGWAHAVDPAGEGDDSDPLLDGPDLGVGGTLTDDPVAADIDHYFGGEDREEQKEGRTPQ